MSGTRPLTVMVTGGAGFIGSAVCRLLAAELGHTVVTVDKLTYAASREALRAIEGLPNHHFHEADVRDRAAVLGLLQRYDVDAVMHLAAETHVDRSIDRPDDFVATNVVGTLELLEATRAYLAGLASERREAFRFHHISTDEVFGDLPLDGNSAFSETTPYDPSSPYAASKAASDHLVRAWGHTFGVPYVLSNCSNNFGPFQFPEKLIPLTIINALLGLPLPVYGRGENVRDWLHVEDHAQALVAVLTRGRPGETYLVGGRSERSNLTVVETICDLLDARVGPLPAGRRRALIQFVTDRPGHDRRYAIDPGKIERELGWRASRGFEAALANTVDWYLAHRPWWDEIRAQRYRGERLGVIAGTA